MPEERRHYRTSRHPAPTESLLTQPPAEPAEVPCEAQPASALEAALNRRIGPLRFPPALERAYQRDTGASRTARITACNVLGAVSYLANTSQVADGVAATLPAMESLRLGTAAFILLAAIVLYRQRRAVASDVVETITSLGSLLIAAYGLLAAHYPPEGLAIVIQTGALFVVFLHMALSARQQFRYVLGTGVTLLACYVLFARSRDATQALIVSGNIMLFSTTFAFTLVANYVLEYRERRAYLLQALQARDRRALADSAEALRRQGLTDALTGLANRRAFDAEMHRLWQAAAAAGQPLAVLQIDVDFFKRYNDHFGHPVGDLCLKRVAQALTAIAGQHAGLAARTGGEEFALLLPNCTRGVAVDIGEALRRTVQDLALPHADSPIGSCVTVSVGAASTRPSPLPHGPEHEPQTGRELLRAADQALYEAKRAGRNRVASVAVAASTPASATAPLPAGSASEALAETDVHTEAIAQRIEELSGVLKHGLRRVKFPAALESAYQASLVPVRARLLPVLGVAGLLYLMLYVWLSRHLVADVADAFLRNCFVMSFALLPVLLLIGRPMSPWWRETLFSGCVVAMNLGEVVALAGSEQLTTYSFALTLFLVPMFSTVVGAQPFRHSLATCVLVLGISVVGLHPARPDAVPVWAAASVLLLSGIVCSLIGGYLIDLGMRRTYLLDRLGDAQRALLTHNAQRLRRLAHVDPLTGVANRRQFDAEHEALTEACAAAGRPLALLILDIDHFKRYNDSHGHPAGDACLRRVAEALREPAAGDEAVSLARIGGEEFAVLLPGCNPDQALHRANALCERVRQLRIEHLDSDTGPHVTVSIGVASLVPAAGSRPRLLLQRADAALYRAKQQGRDRAAR